MSNKNSEVDMELKRAFLEFQAKTVETEQKIKLADIQIEQLKRTKTHSELTKKELSGLNPSTKTYEGVGRMFIYTDIPTVLVHLEERHVQAEEKIKTLEATKNILESNFTDGKKILREMIQQRKEKE